MRISEDWKDYELIDCSDGERLERWKDVILIRPDPQVIWKTEKINPLWKKANARYVRSNTGGGHWEIYTKLPERWNIEYKDLCFNIKTMGFKHTGIFPEQAVNWDYVGKIIQSVDRPVKVLNLFGYTGAASVAALSSGASVVHVDAAKGMVNWAKENAESSGVVDKPVRWIVDDCIKFVEREIRRGNKYDIIIMDPPSYGRGPSGEIWKLEEKIYSFIEICTKLISDNPLAMLINSYTTGLSPSVMEYILGSLVIPQFPGKIISDELGLPVTSSSLVLPCGATTIFESNNI